MDFDGQSSQPPKKVRANWKNDDLEKTFLESCLHETSIYGREGGSLKTMSWKNVAKTLLDTHNFIVDQRQMKNRFDYLKSKYVAWCTLKRRTGNIYDPVRKTFILTEEQWKIEIEKNKVVEKLRASPLAFPELCAQLFDGVLSDGSGSWGPAANFPNPSRVAPENVEGHESSNMQEPLVATDDTQSQAQSQKRKRKNKRQLNSINDDELDQVVTHVKRAFDQQPEDDDMGACIDKLDRLGWEQNPLYEVVLFLFSQGADYRRLWLKLKDEKCEAWAKFTGKQLKLIND